MKCSIEQLKEIGAQKFGVSPDRVKVELKHLSRAYSSALGTTVLASRDNRFYVIESIQHIGDSVNYVTDAGLIQNRTATSWLDYHFPLIVKFMMMVGVSVTITSMFYWEVTVI